MGKTTELMQLLKTGNSDAARKLIAKMKKSGKKKQLTKELIVPDESAHGQTVMHYCAALNFVEFIHELADLGAPIDSLDERGFTPLHLAAGSGRTSAVQALLGKGGDPNVASHNGDTPLHLACSGGHTSTVEALIASQANATGFNVSGHTPLDLASEHGHANAVTMLLRSGQFSQSYLQRSDIPHTALILAAKSGHNEVIGILVKHGFDVNRKLPGANGNSFHEAALYGKVETVKYLLLLGADVQAVNHQGLTALDIVNMYTDPRSAGLMKQVLQDALAQLARVRISQQAQPSHPHQGHTAHQPSQGHAAHQGHTAHQPPQGHAPHQGHTAHQPPQGHAPHQGHTAHSGYPAHAQQRPPSQETHYQQPNPRPQQPQATHQPPTGPSPTPAGPVGFSYIMPGMIKPRTKSEPVVEPHANPSPQLSHAHQQHGQTGHHSQSQAHAAYSQERSQSIQPQPHSNSSYGQPRSHAGHSGMTQRSQSIQVQPSYEQQRAAQQLQQQQQQQYNQGQYSQQQQPQYAQPQPQSQHQQQQYNQQQQQQYNQQQQQAQGTPGVAHHDVGGATPPMDLASQIQAKLAARKPMTTSPTQKDFPTGGDEPFRRSNTMSSQTSMGEIRQAVLRRRGSMTDRSSSSPDREGYDRSNPPTLPRRGPAGPPAFTPVPPIQTATLDRPRRKPTPKPLPPPEPEAENELLKKLMRRQNRIQKAEEEGVESLEPKIDEPIDSEPPKPAAVVGPPPIPERKTPALSSEVKELSPPPPPPQTPPPSSHASPPSRAPPPSQPPAEESKIIDIPKVKSKPRAKPPPTKPKKEEPEVPPWQLELQKKKEKRASESIELAKSMMVETDEQKEVPLAKEVSPSHFPIPPSPVKMLTPPPEPAPPPPSQQPPSLQPVLPPPAENQYEIPPPRVATKKKPSPTARRKIESKPPIPPPTEEPRPPPAELLPPPPTASLPPAVMPPPPSMASLPPAVMPPPPPTASLPPAGMPPPPPTASLPPAVMPQTLPLSTTQTVSQSGQPGTPSSEMSRSTSLSSIPATGSLLQISDPIPIGDWLSSYKLAAYLPVFEEAGYDTTDFLTGITTDELTEIGVSKPGHRKKLMTALSTVHHKEHLLLEKPASVRVWLTSMGLVQYEEVLVEAGYDDIDFISDISGDELQDIGITKNGHLKRFMRGIAELVEVSKSAPPTPSPIPRLQHVNGLATPPTGGTIATFPEDNKTPEPQDDDVTIIAPPVGFDEADLMNQIANNLQPPVAVKSKRFSQDEAVLTSDPSRARAYSGEREGSVPSDGGGGYNRMRQLLEQQMGSSRSTESLEMSVGSESSDVVKNNSRSPSHSPRVARKPKAPPPAPKRSSQTQLSLASLSSSTSSLSSTSDKHDKRASADVGLLMESPPKVPQKTRRSTVEVSQVRMGGGGVDMTDSGGNHSSMAAMKNSFSVEDITAALDDMVSGDEFLADDLPPVRNVPREPVRSEPVKSDGAGGNATSSIKNMVSADRELDVLSRVLQGFDASADDNDSGEADQLLADIDDMLADLNSHLDFITPDDDGTDV